MAITEYPIAEVIKKRWSARSFSDISVEKRKLSSLFEAARWAPSSFNEQPWRYIVFTSDNPEKLDIARSVLLDGNKYARRAPVLICSAAKKTYSLNGKPNRHYMHDLGAASENLFLEANNQGLIMHEMGGFDVEKARKFFKIPEDFEPVAMIAIGYHDSIDIFDKDTRQKEMAPRIRKKLDEIVFYDGWKN